MWDERRGGFFSRLDELHRRRELTEIQGIEGAKALCADGKRRTVFCSNDYLGLKNHPRLVEAAEKALDVWGAGSGASRLITGTLKIHRQLEEKVCAWLGCEAALLFGSGYLASVGVIEALGSMAKTILSDRLNHASLIDGCRLAKCDVEVYEHANIRQLSGLLNASERPALVVTESVFSMEGDHPDLDGLSKLAREADALLFVDEAHALGVYGDGGRGLCAGIERKPDLVMGTLGKALGSYGAFVATTEGWRDFLVNRARTFIFSTAPSPPTLASALAAIELVMKGEAPIDALWENTRYFRRAANQAGLAVGESGGPIVPLVVGTERDAIALSRRLWECGLWVQPIRPPTVPEGSCRLRITISALHARSELDALIDALAGE